MTAARDCSTCGGAPARLYPAGWLCGSCAPDPGVTVPAVPPGPRTRPLTPPGPCRLCGRPSYQADDDGPVHECCLAWRHVLAAGRPCPSCQVSEIVLRQPAHKPDGTVRPVRLPALQPLPKALPDGTPYVPDPPPRLRLL
jgi:hypothetical protein